MNNITLNALSTKVKNALDGLRTAATEPTIDWQVISYAGALSECAAHLINYCLTGVVDEMVYDDGGTNG